MWKLRFHGVHPLQTMYLQRAQIFKSHEREAKNSN